MDPGASKEDEHKIYGQQDEDPLTQERIREEMQALVKNSGEPTEQIAIPHRECTA